jgi:hypothetical protein
MEQSPPENLPNLFPNRRSRYLFVLRVSALVLMLPALTLYALWQRAPAPSNETTMRSTTPQTESQSFTLVTAPESATPESSVPDISLSSSPQDEETKLAAEPTALPLGVLPADAQIISQDGMAILKLPKGTTVLDAQGRPPSSVNVMGREIPLRIDVALVGLAYEFGPEGVTLSPPAELRINFDPNAFFPFRYQNTDCEHLHMAFYDPNAPTAYNNSKGALVFPWLNVNVNRAVPSVTAKVDHLGWFIIFCELFDLPIS